MTVIDLKTRKPLERIETEDNHSIVQFMKIMGKYCKDDKVKSVFVLTINEDNFVNWALNTASEHHLLLAYATLDDLREEIRSQIFADNGVDTEEDEE